MRTIIILSSFFLMLSFKQQEKVKTPVELKGVVLNANTGTPVSNVYVYVVKGEEEVITNNKGEFKLVSWQALPVSLNALHKDYEVMNTRITDVSKPILIRIKHK